MYSVQSSRLYMHLSIAIENRPGKRGHPPAALGKYVRERHPLSVSSDLLIIDINVIAGVNKECLLNWSVRLNTPSRPESAAGQADKEKMTVNMAENPVTVPLLINGKEEYSPCATFDVISPYTNRVCCKAAAASPSDAVRAVEAAEAAFPQWSATKPIVRRDILLKAADLLEQRTEECAAIMRAEMGANVGASQFFTLPLAISILRDLAGRITGICGSSPVLETEGQSCIVFKEPIGVTLGIVPW